MRKILFAINCVALAGAIAAWVDTAFLVPMAARGRVTELDRAGVFDEAKLREFSPSLAANLRNNVADWVQEPMRSTAMIHTYCLGGLAALNIVGFQWLKKRSKSMGVA
jgi:hypothetical protein